MSTSSAANAKLTKFLRRRKEIEEKYFRDLENLVKEQQDPTESLQVLMNMTVFVAKDHRDQADLLRELADKSDLVDKKYNQNRECASSVDESIEAAKLLAKLKKSHQSLADFDLLSSNSTSYKLVDLRKSLKQRYRDEVISFEELRMKHANVNLYAKTYDQASFTTTIFCLKSIVKQLEVSSRMLNNSTPEFEKSIQLISSSGSKATVPCAKIEPVHMVEKNVILKDLLMGVPLWYSTRHNPSQIPDFLRHAFTQIEARGRVKGIYRISPSSSLRDQSLLLLESDLGNFDWDGCDIHVLAGLVKMYFRELPDPIFPFGHEDRFFYGLVKDSTERLMMLKSRIKEHVTGINFDVLKALLHHLKTMASFEEDTKMGIDNLSLLFSTCIFENTRPISPPTRTNSLSSFLFLKNFAGKMCNYERSENCILPVLKTDLVIPDLINFYSEIFSVETPTLKWQSRLLSSNPTTEQSSSCNSSDTEDNLMNSMDLSRSVTCIVGKISNESLKNSSSRSFTGSQLRRMFSMKSINKRK